ncbi:MAG: acyltransferase [Armatimonadetes bacterium]|nr:acyltransferase [Armatimonadota bacterium]
MDAKPRHFNNFDYLRLYLAVEVVFTHLWGALLLPGSVRSPAVFLNAVPTFVALSGFLIPASLASSESLWVFARKRFLRTIPALIPMLACVGLYFGVHVMWATIIDYVTLGYGTKDGVAPLWSLGVEDCLYASMVIVYLLGAFKRPAFLWFALVLFTVLSCVWPDHLFAYRLFFTAEGFIVGNLLYVYREKLSKIPVWLSVLCIVAGNIPIVPIYGLLLGLQVFGAITAAVNLPQAKAKIPDLSYGIYIWHSPIIFAMVVMPSIGREMVLIPCALAATALAAALSWFLVEKPALRLKKSAQRRKLEPEEDVAVITTPVLASGSSG